MVDVAQLVEPRVVIPAVVGSSPIVHPILASQGGPLAQLVEQETLNLLVEGSNPSRPTIQIRELGNRLTSPQGSSAVRVGAM